MPENYIIIEKVEESALKLILQNFANLYFDAPCVKGLRVYGNEDRLDSFLIRFKNQPDFERFSFLVNYLCYPEEYEGLQPFVRGFYHNSFIKKRKSYHSGEWLMVYVSAFDQDHDNVHFANDAEQHYAYSFVGRVKRLETNEVKYNVQRFDSARYNYLAELYPSNKPLETLDKPWWKFW